MTNAEYIRKMDDEELADFLNRMNCNEITFSKQFCGVCHKIECVECMRWWLEQDTKHPQGLKY